MRRAYNAGRYQQARRHARLLLGKLKEAELARSVIVRSYWNEHAYDALIQVGSEWEDDVSKSYVALAREHRMSSSSGKMLTPMKEFRLERLRDAQPVRMCSTPSLPLHLTTSHSGGHTSAPTRSMTHNASGGSTHSMMISRCSDTMRSALPAVDTWKSSKLTNSRRHQHTSD